jgi:predicted nucleic acid-binding protein
MSFTIDASVIVSAAHAPDVNHTDSFEFLRRIRLQNEGVFCPTLVLTECAAAIARQTNLPDQAQRVLSHIEAFPNMSLISLDLDLARRAAQIAISQRLRGADAVYVAVAESFEATLITWDSEMVSRSAPVASALTPADWINQAG